MKYTFISVPALGDKQNTYLSIKGKLTEYAQVYKMNIPDFKVRFCTVRFALISNNVDDRLVLWMPWCSYQMILLNTTLYLSNL